MRHGRKNKTRFRQFTSRPQENLHSSTENELPGPTWSTRGFQPGPQRQKARFQPDPQHQICALRRSTLLHSWHGMPSDLLFQLTRFCIGHFTTGILERQLRETTCLSGAPTQTRDTEKRACNRRTTREETTNKHSIVIHIKINDNREYCISIHFRMYKNHENCISIHLRICWRSTRYIQNMIRQKIS